MLFCSMIFELSLFFCYFPNEHQNLTALNMAAYRYCNGSMLQSAELHDLGTVLMIAIFWNVTPYSMPTLKTNLASPSSGLLKQNVPLRRLRSLAEDAMSHVRWQHTA
jgi:hypothetical protein